MAIQYERAPIIEALIDIRVDAGASDIPLTTLDHLQAKVVAAYPVKRKQVNVIGQFSAGAQVAASATQTQTGFAFSSTDGKQIFQARLDGFTFSRLRPYGNWTELRDEAKRLWNIYRDATGPLRVSRIAVRYINRIDIPLASFDYKDYFRTTPEISPVLPQGLSSFYMELHFPQPDIDGTLILRQAATPPPEPGVGSVILDLDVFKELSSDVEDNELWKLLELLRAKKNEFFEGSLTDKARQLFGARKEY